MDNWLTRHFVGVAYGITGAAPSLQDLTGALTYVEEDHKTEAEEARRVSLNENSSVETSILKQRPRTFIYLTIRL